MSDTEKRDAVLEEFAHDAGVHRVWGVAGMADEILRLRAENTALRAAVERVRALHEPPRSLQDSRWTGSSDTGLLMSACNECGDDYPCPTLRALEVKP